MKVVGPGLTLGLDLSPTLGWCLGRPGDTPRWGSVILPKADGHGAVCAAFEDWLDEFLENERPDTVAYEAPLPPNLQGDRESCIYNFGLTFAAEGCCHRLGIRPLNHSLDTLRGAVIGRTKLTAAEKAIRPRPSVKTLIVEPWVRAQGWDITHPDARDAAVVWGYEVGLRHPDFGRRRSR